MIKKYNAVIMAFALIFGITSCSLETNSSNSEDETITYVGLDETIVFIDEQFDPMEDVVFTSSTRGNINTTVDIDSLIDTSDIGVYILSYHTLYENNEDFLAERRVIVRYPDFAIDNDNLIMNGDFSNTTNYWGMHAHMDHFAEINYIIDPDLRRMQVILNSSSDMIKWPTFASNGMVIDSDETYTLTFLASATQDATFHFDIAEIDISNQEIVQVVEQTPINVGLDSAGMVEYSFEFTSTVSSSAARVRFLFGGNIFSEPDSIIFLDNVKLVVS